MESLLLPADSSNFAQTLDAAATFAEHEALKAILGTGRAHFYTQIECDVQFGGVAFPVFTATIGSTNPLAPAVGFFGGIHGLERIGTQVILHYMRALLFRLK